MKIKTNRPTFAQIDLNFLSFNWQQIKNLVNKHHSDISSDTFMCPMIKTNAYGHGLVPIAQTLLQKGVKYLGVGTIDEGIILRNHGIKIPILIFSIFDQEEMKNLITNDLTPVISNWDQLKDLKQIIKRKKYPKKSFPVHLKFDTGMKRLGFSHKDSKKLSQIFKNNNNFFLEGLCTHLSQGEDLFKKNSFSLHQLKLFKTITEQFTGQYKFLHAINSVSLLEIYRNKRNFKKILSLFNEPLGIRPGILLYGIYPYNKKQISLKPVMTLNSKIIQIQLLNKGEQISYGGIWKAKKKSLIGIVPLGYADGFPRLISNRGHIIYKDKLVPIVGTICMDYLMIDLTSFNNKKNLPKKNDPVTIFGYAHNNHRNHKNHKTNKDDKNKINPIEKLASSYNSIPYEIISRLSNRIPRKYNKLKNISNKYIYK